MMGKQKIKRVKAKSPSTEARDGEDRISKLPEGLLIHILSFVDVRSAVQTSLVSRAWNNLWLSVDTLRLKPHPTTTLNFARKSFDFAAQALDRREPSASHIRHLQYHAPRSFDKYGCIDQNSPIFARVLKFAADRGCRSFEIGNLAFLCQDVASFLPNVTTLHLRHVTFRAGVEVCDLNVFSNCPNLEDLSLVSCSMGRSNAFEISCPKLAKLTIKNPLMVDTDYHKKCRLVVSSPELRTLEIADNWPFPLTVESDSLYSVVFNFESLWCEEADDEIEEDEDEMEEDEDDFELTMRMLRELRGVNHLELSASFILGLSKFPNFLGKQTFGFRSLKSLKLNCWNFQVPDHVMNFLLGDSPSAKVIFSKMIQN